MYYAQYRDLGIEIFCGYALLKAVQVGPRILFALALRDLRHGPDHQQIVVLCDTN